MRGILTGRLRASELSVEVFPVRARLHRQLRNAKEVREGQLRRKNEERRRKERTYREDGSNEERVILLQGVSVGSGERDGELFGGVGERRSQTLAGELESSVDRAHSEKSCQYDAL